MLRPALTIALSTSALLAAALLASALPAAAAPGGPLGTLRLGRYVCETGGDALGPAGVHQPDRDFAITRASSYRHKDGNGVYLLTGEQADFTGGPLKGQTFRRVREGFLREVAPNGDDTDLRCVRRRGSGR